MPEPAGPLQQKQRQRRVHAQCLHTVYSGSSSPESQPDGNGRGHGLTVWGENEGFLERIINIGCQGGEKARADLSSCETTSLQLLGEPSFHVFGNNFRVPQPKGLSSSPHTPNLTPLSALQGACSHTLLKFPIRSPLP